MRILKRIKTHLELLLPLLEKSETPVIKEIIASIVLFVWSFYDKDSNTPNIEFIKKFSPSGLYIAKKYEKKEVSKEEEEWHRLLEGYNWSHTEKMDEVLISYVQESFLKSSAFKKLLDEKNNLAIANRGSESYSQAWTIYNNSFKSNEEEFAKTLVKKFKENSIYLNLDKLQTAVETLRVFDYNDFADDLIEHHLKNALSKEEISKFTANSFDENRDETLIEKLKSYQSKVVHKRSLSEIIDELKYRNGWNDEDVIELDNYSENEYYEFFKNYEGDDLYYRVKACLQFGKFSNASEKYKSVSVKAENSLKKIAEESRINKIRVFKMFGIIVD